MPEIRPETLRPLPLRITQRTYLRLQAHRQIDQLAIQEHVRRALDAYLDMLDRKRPLERVLDPRAGSAEGASVIGVAEELARRGVISADAAAEAVKVAPQAAGKITKGAKPPKAAKVKNGKPQLAYR